MTIRGQELIPNEPNESLSERDFFSSTLDRTLDQVGFESYTDAEIQQLEEVIAQAQIQLGQGEFMVDGLVILKGHIDEYRDLTSRRVPGFFRIIKFPLNYSTEDDSRLLQVQAVLAQIIQTQGGEPRDGCEIGSVNYANIGWAYIASAPIGGRFPGWDGVENRLSED